MCAVNLLIPISSLDPALGIVTSSRKQNTLRRTYQNRWGEM